MSGARVFQSDGPPKRPEWTGHRLAWGAIAVLAAGQFAAYVDRALSAVTAPLIKAQFGLSDGALGALQGPAFVGLYVVGLLMAGHWVGRMNPWRMATVSVVVWTLGGVVFALAQDYAGLAAGRVLLGAGQAAYMPAALAILGAQGEAGRRARSISWLTTASATGRSGALLLGGAALAGLGAAATLGLEPWRATCLLLIAPNLLVATLLWRRGSRHAPPAIMERPGLGAALRTVSERPAAFLALAAAGSGAVLVIQSAGAWAPSILNRQFGLTPAGGALTFGGVVLIFAALGHLGAGAWIARKDGAGPAAAILGGVGLAVLGAVGLAFSPSLGLGLAALSMLTVGGGAAAAAALIGLQALTGPMLRAPVGVLFLSVTSIAGTGAGPWLTGLASDAVAADGQGLARALAAVVAGAAVVTALAAWVGGRRWRPVREGDAA